MNILIAGANGNIGRELIKQLKETPHQATAMIREAGQAEGLLDLGADAYVVSDLEQDVSDTVKGFDSVIFTAGSGGHTGPDKTELVDKLGAMKMVDAAKAEGVKRFIIVSSRHADDPEQGSDKIRHYFAAKGAADDHLRQSGLNYTVVRPGGLTNEPGTGLVQAAEHLEDRSGSIPRADVAAIVIAALEESRAYNRSFDLVSGETPVEHALKAL